VLFRSPHTASAKDGSWDTGIFNGGESKSITFDKPGDYEYYCKVHPAMIARLTVR
jgi:plastocyanin